MTIPERLGRLDDDLPTREFLLAFAVMVLTRLALLPKTLWEFDETLFLLGLDHYDPLAHHPPPPGYPLFLMVGQLARAVIPHDLGALVTINTVASIVGFVLFALAFRNLSGSRTAGIAGALVFYFSPVMLVHSTIAVSDPGALALYAGALLFGTRAMSATAMPRDAAAFGALAAAAVGWRPQFAIAVLPLLFVTLFVMRRWRERGVALVVFTVVCLLWLIPLVAATGGVAKLIAYETRQAAYLTEHDADVSRSNWTATQIATRFILHPAGSKLLSFPFALVAGIGAVAMLRSRRRELLPFAAASLVYLAAALWVMDPADGVRYALPFFLSLAFLCGVGMEWVAARLPGRVSAHVLVALFAAGSLAYTSLFLVQRGSSDSPPVQAAKFAQATYSRDSVVLYELPLWPHATYLFPDFRRMRVDQGLTEYADRPEVPIFIYADGASASPFAHDFRWRESDAYSKLTRNHYRVVSVIDVPPHKRFIPLAGVYSLEREVEGNGWRWLNQHAELRLPRLPARELRLTMGLPVRYPYEDNILTIVVGHEKRTVTLRRAERTVVTIPLHEQAAVVQFEAARSFIPKDLPGSLNRDPRRLSVKLYELALQ